MAGAAQRTARCCRPGRAGHRRLAAWRLAVGAGVLSVLAGGCVSEPATGTVQQISVNQGSPGLAQNLPQMIPVPPGPGWSQAQIVNGFLAASASFANDHAVAREYLTPQMARAWTPGWAATVLKSAPRVKQIRVLKNVLPGGPVGSASAQITGQSLATLTDSGQYVPARVSGSQTGSPTPPISLQKVGGQWRISYLPKETLILTESDFELDYVPRNLYFYGPSGLVPDPVFVPLEDTAEQPAFGLINALLQDPSTGWLAGATSTSFPPGSKLLGVSITATNAVVDLGGAAARASQAVLSKMAAQIVWTLTSSSYSPSAITSVRLLANQKPVTLLRQQLLLQHQYIQQMPARPASRLFYVDKGGRVSVLAGSALHAVVPWPTAAVTKIAVQPGGGEIAGIVPQHDGCRVYAGQPGSSVSVAPRQLSGGTCTSLSLDSHGNIWAAVGSHIWFLSEEGGAPVAVITGMPALDAVTALRVAPDGVRVAMIVQGRAGPAKVLLGAITSSGAGAQERQFNIGLPGLQSISSGIADPSMLSWYDADHVIVLSDAGRSNSQLYLAPLNGDTATPLLTTPPDAMSVTTAGSEAGPGGRLYVGTAAGKIMTSSPPYSAWRLAGLGSAPAYPG